MNGDACARTCDAMSTGSVFKIFRLSEWQDLASSGRFIGSADDRRDGFIHLSYGPQVAATLARHYSAEPRVVVAEFDAVALGYALKAEPSRGGALYPHFYGILSKEDVLRFVELACGAEGFALPDWCGANE